MKREDSLSNVRIGIAAMSLLLVLGSAIFGQQTASPSTSSSPAPLDSATRQQVAQRFALALADEYSYADQGVRMADFIRSRLNSGAYEKFTSPSEFASALQADARSVTHDLHLRVGYSAGLGRVRMMRGGRPSPEMLAELRKQNGAIPEVKILGGNIGYMPVNGMLPAQAADGAIAAAFAFLHNTDALIIDLRANPGGSGYAEVYLSYLSDGAPYVTGSVHWRKDNRVQEFKTTDMGAASYGAKKPVFVLTSHDTFSAAEGLAYAIQAFKRGTIVGETTGGGANPSAGGGMLQLGHGFVANVPTGYVVNAATGKNWEGVGVVPDVQVPPEQALAKAWSLAAAKLKETATNPAAAAALDAIASTTLEGKPRIPIAQIVGRYTPSERTRFSGSNPMTLAEENGGLYQRRVLYVNGARGVKNTHLVPAGGDRYTPEGAPAGASSQMFFIKNGKVHLLQIDRGGAAVWVKS